MQTLLENTIICGDCIDKIKQYIPANYVDLIYMDPPFFSGRNYEVIWNDGSEIRSFEDKEFYKRVCGGCEKNMPDNYVSCPYCGKSASEAKDIRMNDIEAYLEWLRSRVVECYRVLKPTGSIYVHLDWHACHYVKVMMDEIFGYDNFQNEIIWNYGLGGSSARRWSRKHDNILFYSKSNVWIFNSIMKEATSQKMKGKMKKEDDVWEIPSLNNMAKERLGFPTQKPEALLEYIITASSNPGSLVVDPFCGCGTALTVSEKMKRRWIGIDVSQTACDVVVKRLRETNNYPITSGDIIDLPMEVKDLKNISPVEFQNRVNNWLGGRQITKKSGDRGIDGYTFDMIPIQVKQSDGVGRQIIALFEHDIRDIDKKQGIIVAFSFADTAKKEIKHIKAKHGIDIKLITVDELIARGSNCGKWD